MESGPSHPAHKNVTCAVYDARAICAICGAAAIGRNFDAYTCLSCKAFFRRNAYNERLRYTCRVRSKCEITVETRRHCSACRLNKCFEKGMKKELIRSLIAINQASSAMALQQQASRITTTMDLVPANDQSVLLFNDWNLITNIRNIYENYCIQPFIDSHQVIPLQITTQPYRSRLKLQRFIDIKKKYFHVLASFIKHILKIDLPLEDSFEFIKNNLRLLLTINSSELMKSNTLENLPWENDRILFESILTESFLQRLDNHLYTYQTFLPYDPLVVKLFLIILSLTTSISPIEKRSYYFSNDFQPFPKEILNIQNYYLNILWKYIIYRFGYYDAIMYSVRFIQHFLHRQTLHSDMMDILQTRDDHGQLVELLEQAEAE